MNIRIVGAATLCFNYDTTELQSMQALNHRVILPFDTLLLLFLLPIASILQIHRFPIYYYFFSSNGAYSFLGPYTYISCLRL